MTGLPVVGFRELDRMLRRLGFEAVRQHGSHVFYRHPDGRSTTVPRQENRNIARPLLRAILREIGMTPDQFRDVLDR